MLSPRPSVRACVCDMGFSIATSRGAVVLHPLSLVLCTEQLYIKYVRMDGLMDFIAQAGDYFLPSQQVFIKYHYPKCWRCSMEPNKA